MIQVYASAKLRKKLPFNADSVLPESEKLYPPSQIDIPNNPLNAWHAHLITLQRRQCVLMVHDVSRFAVFLPCLTKKDFARLDWHFNDVLINSFLKAGFSPDTIEMAAQWLAPLCFNHQMNRSVQGTMNQMVQHIEHRLWYDNAKTEDLLPYSTSVWLSDRPCMVKRQKECIWPTDAMTELLQRSVH